MQVISFRNNKKTLRPLCVFLVVLALLSPMGRFNRVAAQGVDQGAASSEALSTLQAGDDEGLDLPFSVETIKLNSGSELVTIFYRLNGTFDKPDTSGERSPVPLVSVLRDTLGDNIKENDKLSYVWMLTYTSPSTVQKLMSAVPFYYRRGPSKKDAGTTVPPPIANMSGSSSQLFETILWQIVRRGYAGGKPKMLWGTWRENHSQYKKSAIAEALTILSLYEQVTGEKGLTDTELADVKTRLGLTDKTFGGMVLRENYLRANDKMHLEGQANGGQTRE